MSNNSYVKELELYVEKLERELSEALTNKWIAEQELRKVLRRDPLPVYKNEHKSTPVSVIEKA